jgi:hypothetical protein
LGSSRAWPLPNYIDVIPPQERVMTMLAHRVPLTLLADLLDPGGPASREIYRAEAVADDVRRELTALAMAEAAGAQAASATDAATA